MVKQKLVPYTQQDVTSFRRRFTTFNGNQKSDAGATALYGGKRKHTVFLTTNNGSKKYAIRNVQVAHNYFTILLYN